MVYLMRIENFNAAHKLYNEAWSFEKNQAEFGKCANANWHGHNYKLEVTVKVNQTKQLDISLMQLNYLALLKEK